MSYVLTVVSQGTLQYIDLFAGYQRASESALLWAKAYVSKPELIDSEPEAFESKDGSFEWTFVDTNKTQICVHFLRHLENRMPGPVGPPTHKVVQAALPPVQKPKFVVPDLASPTDSDDPLADHLPAGWSHPQLKPLSVKQLKAGETCLYLSELTEDQKWALVTARINKRPNVRFLVKPSVYPTEQFPGLYSQKYALEELKNRTSVGLIIRDMELAHLHPWLGDGEESEDPQTEYYDEYDSSSSDSFDHY